MKESKAWQQYKDGLSYLHSMGLADQCAKNVRFKEGDQWAAPTERTRNMPRPVFNIIDFVVRAKRSSVLDQPMSIVYRPAERDMYDDIKAQITLDGADAYTDYAKILWKSLGQDELNEDVVDDSATNGTGIYHYYWDSSVEGGCIVPYIGELRGESIDMTNFFVSNPQIRDVQKQKYIIIAQRLPVGMVKKMAESVGLPKSQIQAIESDCNTDDVYLSAKKEMPGKGKVTVLTKYYRKNGEVVYDRCTQSVDIITERPLTPEGSSYRIKRYPVAVMNWKTRKKCFYGIGEVEELIPNQKAINFTLAMELYAIQQVGSPKIVTRPNALKQPITNEPGEHLIDYSAGGDGIRYLQSPNFNGSGVLLADKIIDLTRVITGSTETITGESMGSNMAASAIIALQNQAKSPIQELQKRLWWAIEDIGKIWEEFFKTYYSTPRMITSESNDDYGLSSRQFTGTDYADTDFKLQVDVGASSQYSSVLAQNTLDNFLASGYITPQQYVELSDPNVVPFKDKFIKMLDQQVQAQPGMVDVSQNTMQPAGVGGVQLPEIPNTMSQFKG